MLTRKQHELLMFIDRRLKDSGVSPSFDEMKEALDLKSKSGIHRLITGLEERGFIRRLAHRARALEVLRLPENVEIKGGAAFSPKLIKGNFRSSAPVAAPAARTALQIPLYGRIAAGVPIEAIPDNTTPLDVPGMLLGGGGEHFALEVDGDSMIEAGIQHGDLLVVDRSLEPRPGLIVVAVLDGAFTLKRLVRHHGRLRLEAANSAYPPLELHQCGDVQIWGVAIHVIHALTRHG